MYIRQSHMKSPSCAFGIEGMRRAQYVTSCAIGYRDEEAGSVREYGGWPKTDRSLYMCNSPTELPTYAAAENVPYAGNATICEGAHCRSAWFYIMFEIAPGNSEISPKYLVSARVACTQAGAMHSMAFIAIVSFCIVSCLIATARPISVINKYIP